MSSTTDDELFALAEAARADHHSGAWAEFYNAASPDRVKALVMRLQDAESLLFDIAHDPDGHWSADAANGYFAAHETPSDVTQPAAFRAEERLREAEEALRPFATAAKDCIDPLEQDDSNTWEHSVGMNLEIRDYRRAAAYFKPAGED